MRPSLWLVLFVLGLGLAYQTFLNIDRPFLSERMPRHEDIVRGRAQVPYRYRLLAPWTTEAAIRVMSPRVGAERSFLASYLIYDILAYSLSLAAMALLLLTLGHRPSESLLGAVFMAAVIPLTLQRQWYQPWSILEPGLLALGIHYAMRGRGGLLVAITALSTLNRETGIYVPLAAIAVAPRAKSSWVALALGVAVLLALRAVLGGDAPEVSLLQLWDLNSQPANIRAAVMTAALVLGVIPWVAIQGLASAPKHLRRMAALVPIHLVLVGAFGVWMETRLLVPLLVVLIPIAWSAWFPPATTTLAT